MRNTTFVLKLLPYAIAAALGLQSEFSGAASIGMTSPELSYVDQMGVDLVSGHPVQSLRPLSIGPADGALALTLVFKQIAGSFPISDQRRGAIYRAPGPWLSCPNGTTCPNFLVHIGVNAERFYLQDGAFRPFSDNGNSLTLRADGGFEYTRRDGTRFLSSPAIPSIWCLGRQGECSTVVEVRSPDGLTEWIDFELVRDRWGAVHSRPVMVRRNDGFSLKYSYVSAGGSPPDYFQLTSPTTVVAINSAQIYCAPFVASCSLGAGWPEASFSLSSLSTAQTQLTVSLPGGLSARYINTQFLDFSERLTEVFDAQSSSVASKRYTFSDYTVCAPQFFHVPMSGAYGELKLLRDGSLPPELPTTSWSETGIWNCNTKRPKIVSKVEYGGGVWTYGYESPSVPHVQIWLSAGVGPEGHRIAARTTSYANIPHRVESVESGGAIGTFSPDASNRLIQLLAREGQHYTYTYDLRGNVTEKRQKAGSGLADVVQTAGYDAVCANPVKCNKPNWTRDAMGNQTDYTYDSVHGGVLTETSPPDSRGIRPQKRYTYVQRYAWVKNASGGFVRESTPIWKLNSVSFCRDSAYTGSACAVAGDEVVTQYEYGPDAGPNNLLLRGQVVLADGASRRTCYGYDVRGNKISETTPGAALTSCP